MSLAGKTAIVTGSTSGIGLGIARALAGEGASVMLNGFGDAASVEVLRSDVASKASGTIRHHPADMSKPDEIADLVRTTHEQMGSVDILVNNAGIQHTALIEDFPPERWDAVIAINLSATFHATQATIPIMKQAGWGRIVNIASAHGLVASAQKSAYVAAKHGVMGLTKVAAVELAEHGITCNAICPGWVLTPLVGKQIDERAARAGRGAKEEGQALLGEKQPLREFTTPEQIGALAVFLCSEAARTITGVPVSIDGGWTAV